MGWVCDESSRVEGIDVSGWQRDINWREVASVGGKQFCIVKGAEGTSSTRRRDEHMSGAESVGLMTGLYFFGRPDSYRHLGLDDARREAETAARIWTSADRLWGVELGPVLDFERGDPQDGYNARWALEWLDRVQTLTGRLPWLYTARWAFQSFFRRAPADLIAELTRYPLWLADYDGDPEDEVAPWDFWAIWQYSGRGACPGVDGRCDLNVMRGSAYDELLCGTFDQEYRELVP